MNSIEKYYVSAGIHHIVGKVGDFMSVLAENDAIASVMMWEAMDAVNDGIVIVDKTSRILMSIRPIRRFWLYRKIRCFIGR